MHPKEADMDQANMDSLEALEREMAIFARRLEGARQSWRKHREIDRSAYLILLALREEGELTAGQLAARFLLDISTISRQILPLVEAGWIAKERDEGDKRQLRLSITEAGMEALEATRASRVELYRELVGDWTEEERRTFLALLRRLNERIRARQQAERS